MLALVPPAQDPPGDDATLMQAHRDGDPHAFEVIYARHYDGAVRYAWRMFRRREEAEEICTEVFLALYEGVDVVLSKDPAGDAVTDPVVLFVQSVDRDRTVVEWSIDGAVVAGQTDFAFGFEAHAGSANLFPGTYTVTARVYDNTNWVRLEPRGSLEGTATWTVTRE